MKDTNANNLHLAADNLLAARMNATVIESLPMELRPADVDESYRLQDCLNQKLAATTLGKPVGYKIGCTTRVMQEYLKIPHPCAGVLFESTVKIDEGFFNTGDLCRPGVECELAVQIDRDWSEKRTYNVEDCESLVRAAMVSIELVDDRWIDYQRVDTPTLIADNFFGAGCVLGQPIEATGIQLQQAVGTMRVNGQIVGSGQGSDILEHPYQALCWLANHQTMRGRPLRAGEYVSLGSVIQTQWLKKGDKVEIDFGNLGNCSLTLG